jgi:hypothetical protein
MACARCKGVRFICEDHPWLPFPHDACAGPGEPCPECQPADGAPRLPADWRSITSVQNTLIWTAQTLRAVRRSLGVDALSTPLQPSRD